MINTLVNIILGLGVFYLLNFTLYEYLTIDENNKGCTRIDTNMVNLE